MFRNWRGFTMILTRNIWGWSHRILAWNKRSGSYYAFSPLWVFNYTNRRTHFLLRALWWMSSFIHVTMNDIWVQARCGNSFAICLNYFSEISSKIHRTPHWMSWKFIWYVRFDFCLRIEFAFARLDVDKC